MQSISGCLTQLFQKYSQTMARHNSYSLCLCPLANSFDIWELPKSLGHGVMAHN